VRLLKDGERSGRTNEDLGPKKENSDSVGTSVRVLRAAGRREQIASKQTAGQQGRVTNALEKGEQFAWRRVAPKKL